jgi:predicted nucleic acid-binding protein
MKILLDVNIVLDLLLKREPFYHEAQKILTNQMLM